MKVIFCLPGGTFTGAFLDSWSELLSAARRIPTLSFEYRRFYSPCVFTCRNVIIGGGFDKHEVFEGRDYDYSFWLDSDMVFTPEQVATVLNIAKKRELPIVGGLYPAGPSVGEDNMDDCAVAGTISKGRLRISAVRKMTVEVLPVDFSGWGFMCVAKGVFEAIGYPWIRDPYKVVNGKMVDVGDDFSFCLNAKELGYETYVCPQVIVGHDKRSILWGRDQT
ncbi:MAG: hypothetical protein MUF84_11645 [Anaerolineae bacterium]|nr:hypothetical protein [Anaerolineae bacterium]